VVPTGSIRTLSLVGYAQAQTAFSFTGNEVFDKESGK
jgi:hypothetical protein